MPRRCWRWSANRWRDALRWSRLTRPPSYKSTRFDIATKMHPVDQSGTTRLAALMSVCTLVCVMVVGCSRRPTGHPTKLGIARGCTDSTQPVMKETVPVIPSMAASGHGSSVCIEHGTRVDLSIASVKTFTNGAGLTSIMVTFTPTDQAKWVRFAQRNFQKHMVLMNKHGALFDGLMFDANPQHGLWLNPFNAKDMRATKKALRDE